MCDPSLCPDSPGPGQRCDSCPLNNLDAAEGSHNGELLGRALAIRSAIKLGITVRLDEVDAEEIQALKMIEEECAKWEKEENPKGDR